MSLSLSVCLCFSSYFSLSLSLPLPLFHSLSPKTFWKLATMMWTTLWSSGHKERSRVSGWADTSSYCHGHQPPSTFRQAPWMSCPDCSISNWSPDIMEQRQAVPLFVYFWTHSCPIEPITIIKDCPCHQVLGSFITQPSCDICWNTIHPAK